MTRLSNRQYPMLREFASGRYMSYERARSFDQRPFRSMLVQEWIAYRPGSGFHITAKGKQAWEEFLSTEILRKSPWMPLTRYFDPTAYGLTAEKLSGIEKRLHIVKQHGAA